MKKEVEFYNRKSIFSKLKQFDHLAKEDDFMEITEWKNGEGVDLSIWSFNTINIQLSYGQLDAIKKLIKKLDNEKISTHK